MSTTSHIRIQNIVSIILNSRSKMMLLYIFFELWFMLPNVFFSWNQAYGLHRLRKVYLLKYNNYYKIFLALAKTIQCDVSSINRYKNNHKFGRLWNTSYWIFQKAWLWLTGNNFIYHSILITPIYSSRKPQLTPYCKMYLLDWLLIYFSIYCVLWQPS